MKTISRLHFACAILSVGAAFPVCADVFKFGVLSDTQWSGTDPTGNNLNTVAVNQITAANTQFINAGVDFVVQVGDLGNDGSVGSLQTRLDANAALDAAGIPFYGLRGNHEASSSAQVYFQNNYIPSSTSEVTIDLGPDNTSYAVTYKDTKLILLDILTSTSTSTLAAQTTWMDTALSATDHTQAFLFSHKNLLGQNHKDNQFGSSNDANPALQNTFFDVLDSNNVKYALSGHDHMHHRSIVTSPDGQSTVQEIITASDSYKYYTPKTPYSPRETPVAQQLGQTGYYLFTVDGPRVTGEYYATPPQANGDVQPNPVWTLQDTFGYSLNGAAFTVAQGASYAGLTHTIAAGSSYGENGYVGTTMELLAGVNGDAHATYDGRAVSKDVNVGWAPAAQGPATAASDILTIWGMTSLGSGTKTDVFGLSLDFDASGLDLAALSSGDLFIMSQAADGSWVNAVDLNLGGLSSFVFGSFDASYGLGTYGVDLSSNTAWAVLNHSGQFVVAAVPEPSSLFGLFGLVLIGVATRRRRSPRA